VLIELNKDDAFTVAEEKIVDIFVDVFSVVKD
jgi:hypothetical protein